MHRRYMQFALELAEKGRGWVSPNPMVGALLVKNHKIVGTGWHRKFGGPHAEIYALRAAGTRARDATLYINLEPCSHHGKTPPCIDALIAAQIKKVVYGMKDPNPKVSGRGLQALKKSGIAVAGPVLESECAALNKSFIKWITTGRPYVIAKIALTLDGKIADVVGESKWITNEQSREYVHRLRATVDAVMVGATTTRKDSPKLNVRIKGFAGRQPRAIFLPSGKWDIRKKISELGRQGISSLLVEGGGKLHTSLIKAGLVDELYVFFAPKILGNSGRTWLGDLGRISLAAPYTLHDLRITPLADNVLFHGKLANPR